jgi:N-acetyl sugar amidotransferase
MKFCEKCILPNTRPNLSFDSRGVCSACNNFEDRGRIDWEERARHFSSVAQWARENSRGFDCVIPVSGGKDSTWQTIICLEHGLKPLCVSWKNPARTEIGRQNLENLINLGVDHIDYQVNPEIEKIFLRKSLIRFGATAIPMHMAMFNIPRTIAEKFGIPLIVWGENSAFEYGDAADQSRGFELTDAWLEKYGVTNGTTASDWIDEELDRRSMIPYFGPEGSRATEMDPRAVFLGYYFEWDPVKTFNIAAENGFTATISDRRTGYYFFADLDDRFISIHHYMKWLKFGFPRSFDNLSIEIRHGRITRFKAIEIAKELGDGYPESDIESFACFINKPVAWVHDEMEKFRNPDVWKRDDNGYHIPGFLIPDWIW